MFLCAFFNSCTKNLPEYVSGDFVNGIRVFDLPNDHNKPVKLFCTSNISSWNLINGTNGHYVVANNTTGAISISNNNCNTWTIPNIVVLENGHQIECWKNFVYVPATDTYVGLGFVYKTLGETKYQYEFLVYSKDKGNTWNIAKSYTRRIKPELEFFNYEDIHKNLTVLDYNPYSKEIIYITHDIRFSYQYENINISISELISLSIDGINWSDPLHLGCPGTHKPNFDLNDYKIYYSYDEENSYISCNLEDFLYKPNYLDNYLNHCWFDVDITDYEYFLTSESRVENFAIYDGHIYSSQIENGISRWFNWEIFEIENFNGTHFKKAGHFRELSDFFDIPADCFSKFDKIIQLNNGLMFLSSNNQNVYQILIIYKAGYNDKEYMCETGHKLVMNGELVGYFFNDGVLIQ